MRGDFQEDIRHADLPRHKEAVMSTLYGEVIGWLAAQGLAKGNDFEAQSQDVLQCSKKVIWIDRVDPDTQITWVFNSVRMMVEFGVVRKSDKKVLRRETQSDLRYQISTGSEIALTDGSRERLDSLFEEFRTEFAKLQRPTLAAAQEK